MEAAPVWARASDGVSVMRKTIHGAAKRRITVRMVIPLADFLYLERQVSATPNVSAAADIVKAQRLGLDYSWPFSTSRCHDRIRECAVRLGELLRCRGIVGRGPDRSAVRRHHAHRRAAQLRDGRRAERFWDADGGPLLRRLAAVRDHERAVGVARVIVGRA